MLYKKRIIMQSLLTSYRMFFCLKTSCRRYSLRTVPPKQPIKNVGLCGTAIRPLTNLLFYLIFVFARSSRRMFCMVYTVCGFWSARLLPSHSLAEMSNS